MYSDYSKQLHEYDRAARLKKSLTMTISSNEGWLKCYTMSSTRAKRQAKIDNAKKHLAELVMPVKPVKEFGFDVITPDDDFFAPTTDIKQAQEWLEDNELDNAELIPSKRQITTDFQGLVH